MNERCHTNSVPWMFAVGLNKSGFTESTNCVHSWYGVGVTAFIHATELVWPRSFIVRLTELMWPRSFMVRSWCNHEHSWYGVGVIPQVIPRGSCVHCTVEIHWADFFLFVFHQWRKNPPNFIHKKRTQPWYDLQNRGQPCKKTTKLYGGGSYTLARTRRVVRGEAPGVCSPQNPLYGVDVN